MDCFVCSEGMTSFDCYKNHLQQMHSDTNLFDCFTCLERRVFSSRFRFLDHIKLHFRRNVSTLGESSRMEEVGATQLCTEGEGVGDLDISLENNLITNSSNMVPSDDLNLDEFKERFYEKSLIYTSGLYDNLKICRKTVQEFVEKTEVFMGTGPILLLKNHILKTLEILKCDQIKVSEIRKMFEILENPFEKFKSEYLRTKEFKERNVYVSPIEHAVGDRLDPINVNLQIILAPKTLYMQNIPLRCTLKLIFEMKNSFKTIIEYKNSVTNRQDISNFMQSKMWKQKNEAENENKIIFPLLIYFDDFETNNPLGSRAGIQKLGGVYAICPFLPPEFSSKLKHILLVSCFNSQDRQSFGNNVIFDPLINELKFLESEGIQITVEGMLHTIYFKLGLLLGDNLGLNSILGYTESFSATYCCRLCACSKDELHTMVVENNRLMRTIGSYDNDLLIDNLSLTGRREPCIWNNLGGFHCIDNITVDIMHDILEGVAPLEISLILENLILTRNVFSLDTLNKRISNFNFGPFEDYNLPQTITQAYLKSHSLKYSSSETKTLIKCLPLLIGDLVDEDDGVWSFFLLLRNICNILFAYSLEPIDIDYVEELITEHHKTFKLLFKKNFIPKQHFMIHYANIMRAVGPLRNFWSMRGESKHKVLKQVASSTTSRKNICKTIAIRHQLGFANMILEDKGLESKIERGRLISIENLNTRYESVLLEKFNNFEDLTSYSWVTIKNRKYKKNMALVLNLNLDSNLCFGLILNIFYNSYENTYYFGCEQLETLYKDDHMSSYVVKETKIFCIKSYHELFDVKPRFVIRQQKLFIPE